MALLTLLSILALIDRNVVPALAPLLIAELHLTRAQIGFLSGYAFTFCFVVAGLALGCVADRVHRPRLIAAGMAVWSLFTGASGLARSFLHLTGARLLVGVGEATLTPSAVAMLSDAFPAAWRGRAVGIFFAAPPIGTGLSLVVAGLLAPRFGWRACFWLLGAAGVMGAGLVAMVRDPRRTGLDDGVPGPAGVPPAGSMLERRVVRPSPLRDLLTVLGGSPALLWTIVGGILVAFTTAAAATHVLTWLVEERGYEFSHAAILNGAIFGVAGTIGNVSGGWLADVCARRWQGGRLWSLVITLAVLIPATLVFFVSVPGTAVFFAGWFLSCVWITMWYAPVLAQVQDLVPPGIRATAVAFLLLAVNLGGGGPGSWAVGAIGDHATLTRGLLVATWIGLAAVVPFALAAHYTAGSRRRRAPV